MFSLPVKTLFQLIQSPALGWMFKPVERSVCVLDLVQVRLQCLADVKAFGAVPVSLASLSNLSSTELGCERPT